MDEALVYFGAGALYGISSVISGQPLDSIKTHISVGGKQSMLKTARSLGLRGLYRGSLPVLLGGSTFRSAQFGVYQAVLKLLPAKKAGQLFSYQTVVSGVAGGIARGLIEAPFEFIKVRQQMAKKWEWRSIYMGSGVTIGRNDLLFCSFVTYLDVVNSLSPDLPAFFKGALCANAAWLGIWPLDVIKSRRQSGLERFAGKSSLALLKELIVERTLFAGILPGLLRSTIANGFGMLAYTSFVNYMHDRDQ